MASPGDFMVEVKEDIYYCMICNGYFTGQELIFKHVTDENHEYGVEIYGRDILLIGNNHQYYCSICDRLISGCFNVYIHIHGKKHMNHLYAMEGDEEDEQEYEEEYEDEYEEEYEEDLE